MTTRTLLSLVAVAGMAGALAACPDRQDQVDPATDPGFTPPTTAPPPVTTPPAAEPIPPATDTLPNDTLMRPDQPAAPGAAPGTPGQP